VTPDLGPLDRRIRIEQQGTTDGDYGPQPGSWTTYGTFWATVQEAVYYTTRPLPKQMIIDIS